ncbi:hypothetical protein GQ457_18G006470 [Hibiscus cannabinus]
MCKIIVKSRENPAKVWKIKGIASTRTEYVAKAIAMEHVDVDKVREVIKGTGDSELEHQHPAEQASVHFEHQESVVQIEKSLDLAK